MDPNKSHSLQDILQQITEMSQGRDRVSVDNILDAIGRRSFGPLLVFLGLVLAVPGVGDIPGVPIVFGSIVILTVGQQLFGRKHIWLPQWLLNRSIKQKYVEKTFSYAKKPARYVDSVTTERLSILVDTKISWYLSALACLSIALVTPAMEVVLLSANVAGVCFFLFGLAYMAHDGLVMLISFLLYGGLVTLMVNALFL